MDGISRKINVAKNLGTFCGLRMAHEVSISHLFLISRVQWMLFHNIFHRYGEAS